MTEPKPWTMAEIAAYAERYGLGGLDEQALARMREIADSVARASANIPRVPRKDDEPAPIFRLPLG